MSMPGYFWLCASYYTKNYLNNYSKPRMKVPSTTQDLLLLLACLGLPYTKFNAWGSLEGQSKCNSSCSDLWGLIYLEFTFTLRCSPLRSQLILGRVYHYTLRKPVYFFLSPLPLLGYQNQFSNLLDIAILSGKMKLLYSFISLDFHFPIILFLVSPYCHVNSLMALKITVI